MGVWRCLNGQVDKICDHLHITYSLLDSVDLEHVLGLPCSFLWSLDKELSIVGSAFMCLSLYPETEYKVIVKKVPRP